MKPTCIPIAEIGLAAGGPPDDPRRAHLAACARCRALARMYADFRTPPPLPAAARAEDAEAELARRLAREIGTPGGAVLRTSRRRRAVTPPRAWWGLAAVLAGCAVVFLARDAAYEGGPRLPDGPPVLRGESAAAPAVVATPLDAPPGAWRLTWTAPPAADGAAVALFDRALRELDRRAAAAAGSMVVDPRDWPAAADAAFAAVVYLEGGDEVGRTSACALVRD